MLKKTALSLIATAALFTGASVVGQAQTPPPPDRGAPPPNNAPAPPPPDSARPNDPNAPAPPLHRAPRRRGGRNKRPSPPPPSGNAPATPDRNAPAPPRNGAPPPPPDNGRPPNARAFAPQSFGPRPLRGDRYEASAPPPGVLVGAQPRTIEGTVKYVTPDGLVLKRGIFKKDTLVRFAPQVARQALPIVGVGDKVRVTGLAYKDDTGRTYLAASALTNRRTNLSASAGTYAPAPPTAAFGPAPRRGGRRGAAPPPRAR